MMFPFDFTLPLSLRILDCRESETEKRSPVAYLTLIDSTLAISFSPAVRNKFQFSKKEKAKSYLDSEVTKLEKK